jgi:hypothetical protein
MTRDFEKLNANDESAIEAEQTLRLLAQLPPPAELTDRVHRRLDLALREEAKGTGARFWTLWMPEGWMPARRFQFAAAAVLAVAVAGSTWSVYHLHPRGGTSTTPAVLPAAQGGGFGSDNAERHPTTLTPIKVPPAPKKKAGPSHASSKKVAKPAAAQAAPVQPPTP